MEIEKLITEGRNLETIYIDRLNTIDMLKKINDEDKKVPFAVESEIMHIAMVVDAAVERLKQGGRLIYMGAGTSGRIAIIDASECPPTYGVDHEIVQGIIAGGEQAIVKSVEGAEDSMESGIKDLMDRKLCRNDVVIGIAASGRTPYIISALRYAREIGAYTAGISCNPDCEMKNVADVLITPLVGPEVIMGSTRMKAGTSQKLILNMISTCIMIKLGKVYSNLMVDLQATNEKLIERSKRIVSLATGENNELIENILKSTGYRVKLSILMILTGLDMAAAQSLLTAADGYIAKALENVTSDNK